MKEIGSSETIRKTAFNFYPYIEKLPLHINKIDPSFLEWFVGFSEGDGSFIASKGRLFFLINQKEERVLHQIRSALGFGKVSRYKSYSRFIVADRANTDRLISIFNGNLVLGKTNRRFQVWLDARNSYSADRVEPLGERQITPDGLQASSWLAGLIDAEGCFNVVRAGDPRYTLGWRLRLRFILDQKGELPTLQRVGHLLGSGVISGRKVSSYEGELAGKPPALSQTSQSIVPLGGDGDVMWRFTSTSIPSHRKLIAYLDRHPLRTLKRVKYTRFTSLLRYIESRSVLPWEGKVLSRIERLIKGIGE